MEGGRALVAGPPAASGVCAASADAMRAIPARESKTVVLASGQHLMRRWSSIGGDT